MLDHCSISHKGGIVLWSRSFTPDAAHLASSSASPLNSLIREALIEGRTTDEKFEKDGYAVKWSFVNDLELIFVVAYQRILQLTYVEDLLAAMKRLFVQYFEPFVAAFMTSLHSLGTVKASDSGSWDFSKIFERWDMLFDKLLKGLEEKAAQDRKSRLRPIIRTIIEDGTPSDEQDTAPSLDPDTTQDEQQIARKVQALKNRLRGRGGRRGGRGGRAELPNTRENAIESESDTQTKRKQKQKKSA
jgi:signal recognition particle receptor subunit alpha